MMIAETKSSYLVAWLLVLGVATACFSVIIIAVGPAIVGLVLAACSIRLLYSFYTAHGRTLIFSETGCTVRFRTDEVHLLWDDIVVKRVEPQHWGGNREYTKGCVFFSLRPTKKSPRTDPASYALFHPNTCFWVYFKSDNHGIASNTPGIYEVDKDTFLNQLAEWGVELEHIRF